MARLLVRAIQGYQNPDPEIAESFNYKKGYIVKVLPDGHIFGLKETLPDFVIIDIPASVESVENYEQPLFRKIGYTVVNHNIARDGYRIDAYTTNPTASGRGNLTREKIESFINRWGGLVQSVSTNNVRFDIGIYEMAVSEAVWGNPPVSFAEDDYNTSTGVHTITAAYNNAPVSARIMSKAQGRVTGNGGTVTSSTADAITFTMQRNVILQRFKDDVFNRLRGHVTQRQYFFNAATVDNAIANGGQLSMTNADALAAIVDQATL